MDYKEKHHTLLLLLIVHGSLHLYLRPLFLIKANFWDDLGTPEFYKILCIDMLAAFTIGAIPLIFGLFIVENNALKRNLLEAQKLNKALSERHKDEKEAMK